MTDIIGGTGHATGLGHDWGSAGAKRRVKRRYGADRRLQFLGIGAIVIAMGLLLTLFSSLIFTGYLAFTTTKAELTIALDPKLIDRADPGKADYRSMTRAAFESFFPEVTQRRDKQELNKIMSAGAPFVVRNYVLAHPDKIGETVKIAVPLSDPFDQLNKGIIPREIDALSFDRIDSFNELKARNALEVDQGRGYLKLSLFVDPTAVTRDNPAAGNYGKMIEEAVRSFFLNRPGVVFSDLTDEASVASLRDQIVADPALIGRTIETRVPLAPRFNDLLLTGKSKIRNPRFSSENDLIWFDDLKARGLLATPFSWEIFFNADSRFPELAGLAGALSGSFLALLVCFLLSFPVGIATAVYLEEFAPKNRWTDLIEVNINNLAAVPSVVFGLLGLAVFLGFFGLPRSAPLVGGMVLSLMTLPTIIITTRAALKSVPPSIREAALGVGASKHQVVMHHVLPLAMPGILTGTIIGLAQALGETAPLLLIGMNAFIPSIENIGVLQPAMALPTQIFSWADSPERGFVSRTSAAILVLLGFLIIMNLIAVYLRNRLERKW